ncbi:MAG: PHP domain-containing protein [Gemmatimonadaceae bacterium]|nr:PHP domain-containing protein [Gemmatimonadaceae bacterium]MCW5825503.1 PHP domain-containing protein [Gemmatimonadaceae bacterium]
MTDTADAGAPASFVDLHAHSTASDGALPPTKAVEAAHAAGLAAFALTDHDTLAGIPEAQVAADACGLRLVPGVELSVHLGTEEVHLLGLHIRDVAALQERLEIYRGFRRRRAEEMVTRLVAAGVPVTVDAVLAEAAGGAIGRPHVARALLAAGHVRDMREAFDKWLGAGRPAYVDKERLDIADGIRLIHESGGIAVWAHPGNDGRREQVEPLVAAGLDGIEVRHPSHSREDELRLASLAAFFGLVVSGGSDWHGAMHGGRVLGAMQVPYSWIELQDRRVRERRGQLGQ